MALSLDLMNPATRPVVASAEKPTLIGLDRAGLMEALAGVGVEQRALKMRAQQLWHWLYMRGVSDFGVTGHIGGNPQVRPIKITVDNF